MVHITTSGVALAALLAVAAPAVALPSPGAKVEAAAANNFGLASGRASIKQARNLAHERNGIKDACRTYLKYGLSPPDTLRAAFLNSSAGGSPSKRRGLAASAAADDINAFDTAYTIPVLIGSPPQKLQLDLDTGSSDLWVFGAQTPSSELNGQTLYNAADSRSAELATGYTWRVSYGDGSSASGNVYADVVQIGNIYYTAQAVEVAQEVSSSFTSTSAADGLLGMGFKGLNGISPGQQPSWFANMKGSLESAVFTADLKHDAAGSYNFGYIDSSLYTGSITYAAVDMDPGYWKFTSSGYAVGQGGFVSMSIVLIADTATTLLWLPAAVASAYWTQASSEATQASGLWEFPCGTDLPSFTFGVGGSTYVIPGSYMSYDQASGDMCVGSLQSSEDMGGLNILGNTAFKATFVVFDWTNEEAPQIGWATKNL